MRETFLQRINREMDELHAKYEKDMDALIAKRNAFQKECKHLDTQGKPFFREHPAIAKTFVKRCYTCLECGKKVFSIKDMTAFMKEHV